MGETRNVYKIVEAKPFNKCQLETDGKLHCISGATTAPAAMSSSP
jgi:hypothetical protein